MNTRNTFLSAFLIGTMLTSAAFAADAVLNKEGDVTLTLRADYIKRKATGSSDVSYTKAVNKRNGWGADLQADYYVTANMSVVAGVGYQKFDSKDTFVLGATGPTFGVSSRYIPIRVGFLFHANSFSGLRPYLGGGYEFVNSRHKHHYADSTNPATAAYTLAVKNRNSNGGYVQAGLNYFTADGGVGFNFDVKQSLTDKKNSTLTVTPTSGTVRTHTLKYNPLTVGLGVTFSANGD